MGLIKDVTFGAIDTMLDALRLDGPTYDDEPTPVFDDTEYVRGITNEQKVALFTMAMNNTNYDHVFHKVFIVLGLDGEYVAYKQGFRKRQDRIYDNDPDYIIRRQRHG